MEVFVDDSMEVKVAIPRYVSEKDMRLFIHEKATWIAKQLKEAKKTNDFLLSKQYKDGDLFLFLGKKYPLRVQELDIRRPRIAFDGEKWVLKIPPQLAEEKKKLMAKQSLIKWYQHQAKEILGSRIFHFERQMGLETHAIAVRGQKSVWGTCGHQDKKISLNWQIILAPMEVVDYLAVHELAHLKTPNHSKRFWKHVEKILPDYKVRKKWLTKNRLEMILP